MTERCDFCRMPFGNRKRFTVTFKQGSLFDRSELHFCSLQCTYEAGSSYGRELAKKDRAARRSK